jgi:hypothetical protein
VSLDEIPRLNHRVDVVNVAHGAVAVVGDERGDITSSAPGRARRPSAIAS